MDREMLVRYGVVAYSTSLFFNNITPQIDWLMSLFLQVIALGEIIYKQ